MGKKIKWADPLGPDASPRDELVVRHAKAPHVGVHVARLDDGYFYAMDQRQMKDGEVPAAGPYRTMVEAERAAQRKYGDCVL